MGLTTAMYTGLSGMNANQTRINTIGNNIANVNTTAFKGSRTLFQTQFSRLIAIGNGPTDTSGGVNPTQYGLGALVGATQQNFAPGTVELTGISSDLAINGDGFFILRRPNGQQVYTRDGSFTLDSNNRLVSADGYAVRGFGVDGGYNIQSSVLTDLVLPLGTLTLAKATENVTMDGDLSATGTISTQGSTHVSQALVNGAGVSATANTALTDLRAATTPGTRLFADGNTITIAGIDKGERQLPDQTFVVGTDGSTLGDFASWLEDVLGIRTDATLPGSPGVTINGGVLTINGNAGEQNNFDIRSTDMISDNSVAGVPFSFSQTAEANGSGLLTSFTVYDSLGSPTVVSVTMAMEEKSSTGASWRYYLELPDADGTPRSLGTGTVSFDTAGNFRSVSGNQVSIDRTSDGAVSPLTFTLDFSGIHGLSTKTSALIMAEQDGFPPGTLSGYGVGTDGVVNGTFTNGMTRTLGRSHWPSWPIRKAWSQTPRTSMSSGPTPVSQPSHSLASSGPARWRAARSNNPTSISPTSLSVSLHQAPASPPPAA